MIRQKKNKLDTLSPSLVSALAESVIYPSCLHCYSCDLSDVDHFQAVCDPSMSVYMSSSLCSIHSVCDHALWECKTLMLSQ